MEKIVRLTESDLARIVRRVIIEQLVTPQSLGFSKWSDGGYILRLPKGSTEENDMIRITAEQSGRDKYYVSVMVNGNARMRSEIQNGLTVFRDVQNIFNKKLIRQDAKFESVSGEIIGYDLEKLVKKLSSLKYNSSNHVFTLNESRIVRRDIKEQIVDPNNPANVASTTSVNKLSTSGGPKPFSLTQGCLKGFVMDKSQKYYQKIGARDWEQRKIYPSGKWSEKNVYGGPTTVWGTWKCSGDKILFDLPGTEVGKYIGIDNDNYENPNDYKDIKGDIISKTPSPQYNSYSIKVKSPTGRCLTTMVDDLIPQGSGSFKTSYLDIKKC